MENARNYFWDEREAVTLFEETEFLVGELTKGGVPFPDRERHRREIVRAAAARNRGAYEDALAAYAGGARGALERARRWGFCYTVAGGLIATAAWLSTDSSADTLVSSFDTCQGITLRIFHHDRDKGTCQGPAGAPTA